MVRFVDIPTEQTTAVTDGLLALLALGGLIVLLRLKGSDPWKAKIWGTTLASLTIASALGAVVHGVEVGARGRHLLWLVIYLSLGLLVAFFAVGTLYDLGGSGRRAGWRR